MNFIRKIYLNTSGQMCDKVKGRLSVTGDEARFIWCSGSSTLMRNGFTPEPPNGFFDVEILIEETSKEIVCFRSG